MWDWELNSGPLQKQQELLAESFIALTPGFQSFRFLLQSPDSVQLPLLHLSVFSAFFSTLFCTFPLPLGREIKPGAEEMAQELRQHNALAEDPSLIANAHI